MNTDATPELSKQRDIDDRLAPAMFGLSIAFLMVLASLIVAKIDIPRVVELSLLDSGRELPDATALLRLNLADEVSHNLMFLLLGFWPFFIAESIYRLLQAKTVNANRNQRLLYIGSAIAPPIWMGIPSMAWQGRLWLPVLHWIHPGKQSVQTLSRLFGKPMIAIAFLILPILFLQFVLKSLVENHFWLQMLIHVATGFIWFAFTVEFILMLGVTSKKLQYIKKHWIDLAIILLPLISFLRGIRVLRLAKLTQIQKLAKMSRVYRMRGLGTKLFRALLMLQVVNKILRITPEKRLEKLKALRAEQVEELAETDEEIEALMLEIKTSSEVHPEPRQEPGHEAPQEAR